MTKAINRFTCAIPFAGFAILSGDMQVAGNWDIFDIAGIIHAAFAGGFVVAALIAIKSK